MKKTDRILLIGGLGFIGKNLYIELKKRGISADIFSNTELLSSDPFFSHFEGNLILGDIRNIEDIKNVIRNYNVAFSLAGISGAVSSNYCPYSDMDINLKGHMNILEACREKNSGIRLIFPSSRLVYGKPYSIPVNENHPIQPESIYAVHKLTVENYYILYRKLFNIDVIILRISNPYGPFQDLSVDNYGIINMFIMKAIKRETIQIFGDGHQQRDYLFIQDLGELFIDLISAQNVSGEVFNIGYGKGISLINSVLTIKQFIPELTYEMVPWPEKFRKVETGDYVSNISKIETFVGWKPTINFEEGISKTIRYYREYIHVS
ncbi:MAG: NAD-dependent epimerase/dehydratase family protein [Bacteroidales bacterium]|nr:NAD-dependent epimerase/dehydratase family protein [Bacteroidales bacterium]